MAYTEVPGAQVSIRMWADPATVEGGAMQQLRNVATLPWIKGLAVMPDVHYGKGATVGSVIAMHGVRFDMPPDWWKSGGVPLACLDARPCGTAASIGSA